MNSPPTPPESGLRPEPARILVDRRYPAQPVAVAALRADAVRAAAEVGVAGAKLSYIGLAVSEAATNVVQHAYDGLDVGDVHLVVAAGSGTTLEVTVTDTGRGVDWSGDARGQGLGLAVMAELADAFQVRADGRGTEVSMQFRLGDLDAAA